MISNVDHRYNWANKLSEDHFTNSNHRRVFDIITNNKKMCESDLNLHLHNESRKKGFDYSKVQEVYEMESEYCQDEYIIEEINRYKHYRHLKELFDNINPNDPRKEDITALYESLEDGSDTTENIGNGTDAYMGVYQRMKDKTKEKRKIETGFHPYDDALDGGISKGLHIIGARPSGGKTTYGLEVLLAFSKRHKDRLVVFFSCEVGAEDLWYKVVANRARVPLYVLEKGEMNQRYKNQYDDSCRGVVEDDDYANFIYVAAPQMSTMKAEQLIKKIEKQYKKKVDLVGFDYLQIMQPNDNKYFNETERVQKTSSDLRVFSSKVKTIAMVQVNRDGDNEECPETKHIKSSSQIEQDASTVLFLWWNDKAKCEMCTGLKKNRYGASEIYHKLLLDGPTGRIAVGQHTTPDKNENKRSY